MTTTIYKIVISNPSGIMVNSANVLFTIPKKDVAQWQERIKQHIINRFKMPEDYIVDFAETTMYKYAKQNYINLKTRRMILDAMKETGDLDKAIKVLSENLTKSQITRLSDDLMLRWRIMEAAK